MNLRGASGNTQHRREGPKFWVMRKLLRIESSLAARGMGVMF